jgi:hypothetical protein
MIKSFFFLPSPTDLESLHAITVKPSNNQQQPIIENSHGEAKKKPKEEDRVVRYIPFMDGRQQQLDNLHLVRVT